MAYLRPCAPRHHGVGIEHHLRGLVCALGPRERAPRFALRGIKFIDDYIANPCYGLLLVTGLALVFSGKWPWPRWILTAVALCGADCARSGRISVRRCGVRSPPSMRKERSRRPTGSGRHGRG